MNYLFLYSFVIFRYLFLSTIYGCVTFQNPAHGKCSVYQDGTYHGGLGLRCMIMNPLFQIQSIECNEPFHEISFTIFNLNHLDTLFSQNNQTVFNILKLYHNSTFVYCTTKIHLVNLPSPPTPIHISFDHQFISKIYFHDLKCLQYLLVNITARDWGRIDLSINENIKDINKSCIFELNLNEESLLCKHSFAPRTARWPLMLWGCSNYIKLIDRGTYIFC